MRHIKEQSMRAFCRDAKIYAMGMRKHPRRLFFPVSLLLACSMTLISKGEDARQNGSAKPKITVSPETTCFTEPLSKDGSLDCVALLNKMAGEGVDVDNNAVVVISRALGPEPIPVKKRAGFYQLLGIATLPQTGHYYITFGKYVQEHGENKKGSSDGVTADNANEMVYKQFDTAQKRPWNAKEFPLLADLLSRNEKPLELISQAVLRPKFYSPLVKTGDAFSSCLDTDFKLPLRDVARQYLVRAMLRLDEKQYDRAWQDLMSCYRLGRLVAQGPLVIDVLFGTAFQGMAAEGIWTFAGSVELSALQSHKCLSDLQQLPLPPDTDRIWRLGERIFEVGYIYDLSKGDRDFLKYFGILKHDSSREALRNLATDPHMDWDEVLRLLNAALSKYLTVLGEEKYVVKREKAQKLDADIAEECRKALEPAALEKALSPHASPKDKARHFVAILSNSGIANAAWTIPPPYRSQAFARLSQLSLALSVYHAENHSYPATLADLVTKYISEVPNDPFSSENFRYTVKDGGYLLYSVGMNAKDDGGKNYLADNDYSPVADDRVSEGEKATDDIVVRVPPRLN
jgi:hypothetical protein